MSNFSRAIFLLLSILMLVAARPVLGADQVGSIEVEIAGVLRTGIVAIGGETTGVTISAKGITWELELGASRVLRETASRLDGKFVRVKGALERRAGVEIKERWIVTVSELGLAGDNGRPNLEAETQRADSRIEFASSGDEVVADVHSKSGIGSATITRNGEAWPETMKIRLRLRGLESFKVESGETTVEWSKSSTGQQNSHVSLRRAGKEEPVGEDSPYHSKVETVGGNGKVPLVGGYFEIALPGAVLKDNPDKIKLRWIDFYR
ncbi:MAG: hypothetical protein ACR2RV_08590 [Verrucomicrobiales bacterium]